LSRFDFWRIEIWIVLFLFTFFTLFILLLFVVVIVIFKSFTGEKKDGSGNDPITNIVANFEISCQQVLSFWVDIRIRIVRNWWGIEKVEKAIIFDLFSDCANISFTLVFLSFLLFLQSGFLRLFPVNCASLTLENLGTFKTEWIIFAWFTFHFIFLGEHGVWKVVIWRKGEV